MLINLYKTLCIALIAIAITIGFWPGLTGPFVLDDQANLVENEHIRLTKLEAKQLYFAATTPLTGYPFSRAISYLSFSLNYYFSGNSLNNFNIKTTNLAIHAVNATLVFLIIISVLNHFSGNRKQWSISIALVITLLWAIHPIQVSTVSYSVQRMTLLSGTTVLLGCWAFVRYRISAENSLSNLLQLLLILLACLLVGFHCKENAILLPAFIISLEILLRPISKPDRNLDKLLTLLIILPAFFGMFYLSTKFSTITDSYVFRDFDLKQRLLTEPRVLFWYLKIILLPQLSNYSLFLDNYPISTSLFAPLTTITSIAGWISISLYTLITRKHPLALAALTWYIFGHSLESSFIPLEIAFEHRNYIPSIAPIALSVVAINHLIEKVEINKTIPIFLFSSMIALCLFLTFIRATYWGDKIQFITYSVENQPASVRARSAAGLFYITRDPLKAIENYRAAQDMNPGKLNPVINQLVIWTTILNIYPELANATSSKETSPIYVNLQKIHQQWNQQEIEEKIAALRIEIERILKTSAISAQVMGALKNAVQCRIADEISCPDAFTLLSWINIAKENKKKKPFYDAYLDFHQARLLVYQGNLDSGLKQMRFIVEKYPNIYYFTKQLDELYLFLEINKKQKLQFHPHEFNNIHYRSDD